MKFHHIRNYSQRFAANRWTTNLIRLGYFIRGILYGFIGIFALGIATGFKNKSVNQHDIIVLISHLPFGDFLLLIFLAGLGGYSLWGFIRANLDYLYPRIHRIPPLTRLGYIFSGIFYGSLLFSTLAIITYQKSSAHEYTFHDFSEIILHIPLGQVLVTIISIAICISGLLQIRKAVMVKTLRDLNYAEEKVRNAHIFMILARIGIAMRGLLWLIIGIFGIIAAVYADPSRTKGTDEAFSTLAIFPWGHALVGILALGFIFFGIYSLTLSFWVALPTYEKLP